MNVPEGIYKPTSIIQDKRLSAVESDYLCLIGSLGKQGPCTQPNQFFANYFGVSRPRAVEVLTNLKTKGFIMSVDKKQGGKVIQRTITITDGNSRKSLLLHSQTRSKLENAKPDSRPKCNGSGGPGRIKYE
jgi:hypothetical protein